MMATNFPTSADNWSNPISTTDMAASGYEHDLAHSNWFDAVEAIENEWLKIVGHLWPTGQAGDFTVPATGTAAGNHSPGDLTATPFVLTRPLTVTNVKVQCTTGVADSSLRLGFYAPAGSGDIGGWGQYCPGALISQIGTFSGATTAYVEVTGLSINLPTGLTWLVSLAEGTGTAGWSSTIHNTVMHTDQYLRFTGNAASGSTTLRYLGIARSGQATGSLPDPFGGVANSTRYTIAARIGVT